MKTRSPTKEFKALCVLSLAAAWLSVAPASALAQTSPSMAPSASMPHSGMKMGSGSPHDMKASMMKGMESMRKMPASGDVDKDFAMMMKLHHQQALEMAQMELERGKSPEMKAMAKQIITAQKKEIAQFDQWLAKKK